MSALAEALVAAQRRAVAVLGLCPACAEREAAEWEPDEREREQAAAREWEQRTLRAEYELGHIGGAP